MASQAGDHNEELDSQVNDMGSMHIDENEETGLEVPEELRTSILEETLEMADKLAPQKAAPCDSAVEEGCKTIDQSTHVMETADAATHDEASRELSENLEACPGSEMIVQEGDGAEPTNGRKD
ncbi:uncharacterized protein Fot_22989 [Forsythia ovata]|uniref:Uncharacterized protein n=1 Tax=Forsythia ovata TaxID=205694 RepID=A0ABD1V190_9LAMI